MALVAVVGLVGTSVGGRTLALPALALPARSTAEPAPPAATPLADALVAGVDADALLAQLKALQQIADAHGGNRASGTPGYEASVELVANQLRTAGFDVTTPSFTYREEVVQARRLVAGGRELAAERLGRSAQTPAGGISGPLVVLPEDETPGCDAADLAGLPVAGAVVLVRRGACTFQQKTERAVAAGAVAVVVANSEDGPLRDATLGETAAVPVGGVSREDGDALRALAGRRVTLDLRAAVEERTGRNVIAQTRTGRPDAVVMLGGHLDSVPAGPGINDNGSGAAGLLELALALGSAPDVDRAVRFAWFGAEEIGLVGSEVYVESLDRQARNALDLYLNVDMIGSPNPGYFVYDGDDSADEGEGAGPAGSSAAEQTLLEGLARQGIAAEPTDFDGRSDYGPFIRAGIAAGGLFSGAESAKSDAQAARWGGRAGEPFDPCYHQECDNLGNIDGPALERHVDALGWTLGRYAQQAPGAAPAPDRDAPVAPATAAALPPRHARRATVGRSAPDHAPSGGGQPR